MFSPILLFLVQVIVNTGSTEDQSKFMVWDAKLVRDAHVRFDNAVHGSDEML